MIKPKPKWNKRILAAVALVFTLMNVVAIFHSYKFTHFTGNSIEKTGNPRKLSTGQKLRTLVLGVSNPRPTNAAKPTKEFQTIVLQSNKTIECWIIKSPDAKGTVILFHGFGGEKSSLLDKAEIFQQCGFNTMLVDFMGSGGSEGTQTTIGYKEAEQVTTTYNYLRGQGEKNIYLFGTSMGAVAIMKSIRDDKLEPKGIIIECPFGSMYRTVCARFRSMNTPTFPMAALLVFWGGVQNNFWAFGHRPIDYANEIDCPTLLMYGGKDEKVSLEETSQVLNNLKGEKQLRIYPEAGHENYLLKYKEDWTKDVKEFLNN